MYTRADITLDDRLEIFSRYWRFGADYGTVSRLAEEFRTSRQFIYDVATRVKEALEWRPAGRQEVDRRSEEIARLKHRIRELEADCGDLTGQLEVERAKAGQDRFRLLLELAFCPVSEDKIVRCLEVAFGPEGRVSVGWVNSQLQKAGEAALAVMQRAELRKAVREAALDELFRHRQPILCVIDPQTLLATIPQAAENRKGKTWQTVLKQYPNLEFVVSDQASGLRKGVNACGREIAHQYDLFHFKREIGRWLRGQEARCYELMEQVEQARRLIDAPRLLSSARMQARVECWEKAVALDERLLAFDWIELIVSYLYESLTAYDARRHEIRTRASAEAIIDEAVDLLKEVEEINAKPLISMIEGARGGLLTFLTALEEKLQRIEIRWRYVTGSRLAAFLFMHRIVAVGRNHVVFLREVTLMEITINATIPDNVAAAIQNGSTTPLPRRLLELAAIKAHEAGLITEHEVMEMLGFEDREELYEFFKRYDVRSAYTAEDFEREGAALEEMLAKKGR